MEGNDTGPLPGSSPFVPSEMDGDPTGRAGRAGNQPNDMTSAGHKSNAPMDAPGPDAPRSPAAFQRFTGNGEFADAGEQLADLINAALQAQARRRGLS